MKERNQRIYRTLLIFFAAGIVAGTGLFFLLMHSLYGSLIHYLPLLHTDTPWIERIPGLIRQLCQMRLPFFFGLVVLLFSSWAMTCYRLLVGLTGVGLSLLICVVTALRGIPGVLYGVLLLLPHGVIYFLVVWSMFELTRKRSLFEGSEQVQMVFRMLLLWCLGILTEALCSPIWIQIVLQLSPDRVYR